MNSFTQKFQQTMRTIKYFSFLQRIETFSLMVSIFIFLFSSCVSQKNVEYLRDTSNQHGDIKTFYDANISDYKLKPNDELFIQIKSLDDPSTNIFQQKKTSIFLL